MMSIAPQAMVLCLYPYLSSNFSSLRVLQMQRVDGYYAKLQIMSKKKKRETTSSCERKNSVKLLLFQKFAWPQIANHESYERHVLKLLISVEKTTSH